jgi:hypothetical protein
MFILSINRLFFWTTVATVLIFENAFAATEFSLGKWSANDEARPGVVSVVELFIRDQHLHGRILVTRNLDGQELQPVCEKCPGVLSGKPIKGMEFIKGLKLQKDSFVGGTVIDFRPGLTQGMQGSCDISINGDLAVFTGYWLVRQLGQSRVWVREKE